MRPEDRQEDRRHEDREGKTAKDQQTHYGLKARIIYTYIYIYIYMFIELGRLWVLTFHLTREGYMFSSLF